MHSQNAQMKLLLENWNDFLNEEENDGRGTLDAAHITTIGELHKYFQEKDPGTLKTLAAKYGGLTAKMMGVAASIGIGGADMGGAAAVGAGVGEIAEKVVEQLLMASIMAFADIEDGTYGDDTAANYFDLDDKLTVFLRHLQTKGKEIAKPSQPEMEIFKIMKKKIVDAVKGGVLPDTKIQDLLKNVTSQSMLDARLKSGEYSGAVQVTPVGR